MLSLTAGGTLLDQTFRIVIDELVDTSVLPNTYGGGYRILEHQKYSMAVPVNREFAWLYSNCRSKLTRKIPVDRHKFINLKGLT